MNYWVIADTHFGHEKIKQSNNRPDNFEELILENLKAKIKKDDVLIHLGDFCLKDDLYWHKRFSEIECKKWLILGNHDHKTMSWYLSNGWDFVCSHFTLKLFGEYILFSHTPQENTSIINIHGHLHDSNHRKGYLLTEKNILVLIEGTFEPCLLQKIIKK